MTRSYTITIDQLNLSTTVVVTAARGRADGPPPETRDFYARFNTPPPYELDAHSGLSAEYVFRCRLSQAVGDAIDAARQWQKDEP